MQPNQNLTHVQDRNTKVKLMLRISENFYVGSKTGYGSGINWKVESGSGSEKNHNTDYTDSLHESGPFSFIS